MIVTGADPGDGPGGSGQPACGRHRFKIYPNLLQFLIRGLEDGILIPYFFTLLPFFLKCLNSSASISGDMTSFLDPPLYGTSKHDDSTRGKWEMLIYHYFVIMALRLL
jgi:hypothetical protein